MAAEPLPQHLILAGSKLLRALDDAGLQPQGAAWIYHHEFGDWKFYVATSLLESMGRTAVYKNLLKIMGKLDMPEGLTAADIHLNSVDSPLFRAITSMFHIQGWPHTFTDCKVNGVRFDAVVYRLVGKPDPATAKKIERTFKRKVKELSG